MDAYQSVADGVCRRDKIGLADLGLIFINPDVKNQ